MTTPTPDLEPTAPTTDEATTPTTPSREATRKVRPMGWGPTSPEPLSPATPLDAGDAEPRDFPGMSDELPEPRSTRTGESRGSSRASKIELRKAIRTLFIGATGVAHDRLVRDEYNQHVGLLLADEEDGDDVSVPAANIASRRLKDAPIGGDVADGIELGMALINYVLKQLDRRRDASRLRRQDAVIGDGLQHEVTGSHEATS